MKWTKTYLILNVQWLKPIMILIVISTILSKCQARMVHKMFSKIVSFNSNTAVWWGVNQKQKQQLWFEYSPYLHPPPSDNTPPPVFYLCILHPPHLIQYTYQLYSTAQQQRTHSTQPVGTSKGAVKDSPHPREGLTTPSAFKPGNLNIGFSSTLTTPAGDI